jgi:hypothetical protein
MSTAPADLAPSRRRGHQPTTEIVTMSSAPPSDTHRARGSQRRVENARAVAQAAGYSGGPCSGPTLPHAVYAGRRKDGRADECDGLENSDPGPVKCRRVPLSPVIAGVSKYFRPAGDVENTPVWSRS